MRISNLIAMPALWVLNVMIPGLIGIIIPVMLLKDNPASFSTWLISLMISFPVLVVVGASAMMVKKLSAFVMLDIITKQLTAGVQKWTVDGDEACVLEGFPSLKVLRLNLHDGTCIKCVPTFALYFEIKSRGAQKWWSDTVKGC